MSLLITDNNLGIEVSEVTVKIGYFTVNRMGFFEETGLPKFSANLYLEYSKNGEIYKRGCISIDNLGEKDFSLKTLYKAMKERPEFESAEDDIPKYAPPVKVEEVTIPAMETPTETLSDIENRMMGDYVPTETPVDPVDETVVPPVEETPVDPEPVVAAE